MLFQRFLYAICNCKNCFLRMMYVPELQRCTVKSLYDTFLYDSDILLMRITENLRRTLYVESTSCLKVIRPKLTWFKFFNHSKNDTVTPPLLINISGIINRSPFARMILSAAGVVGPLAASAIT